MKQTWNAKTYVENARFVSDLGMSVVEWLAPQAGERILDLGCGDGVLTLKLKDFGCEVIGVDSSPNMINSAKSLGLDARLLDGQELNFNSEFDAVFILSCGQRNTLYRRRGSGGAGENLNYYVLSMNATWY